MVNKAKEIFLDPRSRFYKTRLRALTAAGYSKGKRGKFCQQLTLDEND